MNYASSFVGAKWRSLSKDDFVPLMKQESSDQISGESMLVDLDKTDQYILIDVRTAPEYQFGHLKNSVNISLDLLPLHIPRLDKDAAYVLYSDTAFRSDAGASALNKLGFNAKSLTGGLRGLISQSENSDVTHDYDYITTQSYWLHDGVVVADQSSETIK
jgi:phage shock protein E